MNSNIERNRPSKSNPTLNAIAALYLFIAITVAAFSLYLTYILQWQGPFRDLWEFVDDIEQQFSGHWSMSYLLDAYGGAHRIFLPKLLFFADYYWFGGRNDLTIAVALLCQFLYGYIIWKAVQSNKEFLIGEKIIALSLFALALFSTTQVSNFLYAMDVQWYMSNALGLLSLYCLSFYEQSRWRCLLVITIGIAAALCNFTGLMPIIIAIITISLNRQRRLKHYAVLALLFIISFLYVHNGKNSGNIVISSLQHSNNIQLTLAIILNTLKDMAIYIPRYLSSPLSREWPIAGYGLALAGIGVTLRYWLLFYRNSQQLNAWQKLCLYISSCIIISAIFTAFGRVIYPNSSVAERYQTLVLPWLPALFGMWWSNGRNSQHAMLLLTIWTAIFFSYLLPVQTISAKNMVMQSVRVNLAHTAARAGVLEPPYILATLSYPLIKNKINSVKDNDNFLRSHTLGYFQYLPQYALGKVVSAPSNTANCTGYTTYSVNTEAQAWILEGQLTTPDNIAVTDILVTQNHTIKGLGTLIGSDNSFLPKTLQPAKQSQFRAFANINSINTSESTLLLGIKGGIILCQYTLPPED